MKDTVVWLGTVAAVHPLACTRSRAKDDWIVPGASAESRLPCSDCLRNCRSGLMHCRSKRAHTNKQCNTHHTPCNTHHYSIKPFVAVLNRRLKSAHDVACCNDIVTFCGAYCCMLASCCIACCSMRAVFLGALPTMRLKSLNLAHNKLGPCASWHEPK